MLIGVQKGEAHLVYEGYKQRALGSIEPEFVAAAGAAHELFEQQPDMSQLVLWYLSHNIWRLGSNEW